MGRNVQKMFEFKQAKKRAANKAATCLAVKKPKLPSFTAQQFAVDDESQAPIIQMTIEQWYNVPRNPCQKEERDTSRKLGYLYKFIKEHATARMGVYPDGRVCKIDCHSRGRLYYEQPELVDRVPKFLNVECYPVRDDEHAAHRFDVVDNRKTSKNAADNVHGAFRMAGVPTTSKFFRTASNIKAALGYAYEVWHRSFHGKTVKSADVPTVVQVKRFKEGLAALDRIAVNRNNLTAPFIMAFLLGHKKHLNSTAVVQFFAKINEGTHGQRKGKKMCPIAAIEKERDGHVAGGREQHVKLASAVLGALDTYMVGYRSDPNYLPAMNMQKVMTVDLDQYLIRANAKRTGRTLVKREKRR